ncbi:hypothetical protein J6590_062246, partial [Homalodisca vitripennis]
TVAVPPVAECVVDDDKHRVESVFRLEPVTEQDEAKTYTCMRRVAEQTTGLGDTERWFMNAYPRKRVCSSSTDCPIQLNMPQRLRR